MSVAWTPERIVALSPDPASTKAGQALASARKWVSTGQNERALWGECQGSGANPYQTQIDLSEPAFKCSCPSRKFPCKHGLGLFLLLGPLVPKVSGAPPEWVTKWLTSRDDKQQAKKEKADKPAEIADPAAQAKRAAERLAKIAAGVEDLSTWLCDLARTGFAALGSDAKLFEQTAARLVDAQAPGAARLVRQLAPICHSGDGWPTRMLDQVSRLQLLAEAFGRLEKLPAAIQADVKTLVGIPVREEDVLAAGECITDTWLVLGQKMEEEDRLRAVRTWLVGKNTGRAAMILEFSHMAQPLKSTLVSGTAFDAEISFYPSAYPTRGVIKQRKSDTKPLDAAAGFGTVTDALAAYGAAAAAQPWLERFAMPLARVTPMRHDRHWYLQDEMGDAVPLAPRFGKSWEMLALSGGTPVAVFGEFDGSHLTPMGLLAQGAFHALG